MTQNDVSVHLLIHNRNDFPCQTQSSQMVEGLTTDSAPVPHRFKVFTQWYSPIYGILDLTSACVLSRYVLKFIDIPLCPHSLCCISHTTFSVWEANFFKISNLSQFVLVTLYSSIIAHQEVFFINSCQYPCPFKHLRQYEIPLFIHLCS